MNGILIKNGKIVRENAIYAGNLLIRGNKIADTDYRGETPTGCICIDACGKYIAPGFIDIHVHGGGGYDFMDCTVEAFTHITDIHLKNGTTTIVPTAVSSSFENILKLIEVYKESQPACPTMYGLHLEGPYISPNQKGAHKEKYLHSPNREETEKLLGAGKGIIKRITAAPELDHMREFAESMLSNDVSLSIGHSDATSDIALEAFEYGFSHVTHLYSATPGVRKINQVVKAGVIEAAYLNDKITVELIADGKHAAQDALKLAVKIKGADKVALVTDALRPAGTNVTESWLGEKIPENRVIIEDGVAKLPDRSSFAGSVATSSMLLEKGITHYGLSIPDTVKMLTETPAKILGLKDKGRIKEGYIADIVLFNEKFEVCDVILNGEMV
ncbi:MAG: N-acetylglucosamine-6-phosphate deacetylase [Roseburia sp.]|nr:N-acetylglucosamine-6-phosphate deacetylase [Roseburia sp.]